jgi:hypothetical protein
VRHPPRIAAILCATLALAGCIQSSGPILSDTTPVFGQRLKLQLYALHEGHARDPEAVTFTWNGARYARSGGSMRSMAGFTVHAFDGGDHLLQTVPTARAQPTEFAIAHQLAEGVWQVVPVDEADADEATRTAYCTRDAKSACQIERREALFAFARATAARRHEDGGLAIRLPDGPERPTRRARPSRPPARR